MNIKIYQLLPLLILSLTACNNEKQGTISPNALKPVAITDTVGHDTDDPAIWIHPADSSKSLIIGTDKDTDGGLYAYNLDGRIVNKVTGLKRPNNVDIAYGLNIKGKLVDIAVATERETNMIRIYSLPDLKPLDKGGIPVFEGENQRDPMGVSLYTAPDSSIYAIVGRKTGPSDQYLWQYKLTDNGLGGVKAEVVRKFGKYSGKKEIEAIAVDNESGFIYYSDETVGVHKYYADPTKGNEELAFFAQDGFTSDHEGISIYKTGPKTGYILISNQQKNSFMVYPREGSKANIHEHQLITEIDVSTIESDGSDVTNVNLGPKYPNGLFVAMSNGKVFQYYDWRDLQKKIDSAKK